MKKLLIGLLLTTTLFGENEFWKFFKYSTAYAGFNLSSPKWEDDRYILVDDGSWGAAFVFVPEIEKEERNYEPDFDVSVGIRKIGRFQYESKRGVKNAGVGGDWYKGDETNFNESATIGRVTGWEYLLKYSTNRRWDEKFISQEYYLRYLGNNFIAKVKYLDLELEDLTYSENELRFRKQFDLENANLNISVGVSNRNHPVYGFAPQAIDSIWYTTPWWAFAEEQFGFDYRMYTIGYDENGYAIWEIMYDDETGEEVALGGTDFRWFDEDGNQVTLTNAEFYSYHYPRLLETWFEEKTKELGNQSEISLSLGLDYYKYTEKFWVHAWGSLYPIHYGFDKYSYHNAVSFQDHLDEELDPRDFKFEDTGVGQWFDYDLGAIIGFKLQDNLGFYTEGKYLNYWERPSYELKVGLNYQIVGM